MARKSFIIEGFRFEPQQLETIISYKLIEYLPKKGSQQVGSAQQLI